MSTRSRIGLLTNTGSIVASYCHWDGYPSWNGLMLATYYTELPKVKALLLEGDISSLDKEIGSKHSFDKKPDGVCNFYGRDRGEPDQDAKLYKSIEDYLENGMRSWEEYLYLYVNGQWFVTDGDELPWTNVRELALKGAVDEPGDWSRMGTEIIQMFQADAERLIPFKERVDFFLSGMYNKKNGGEKAVKPTEKETQMTTTSKISRLKLEGFLLSQAGRFIGIKSTLKDGKAVAWNGRVVSDSPSAKLDNSYITFHDNNRAKKDAMGTKGGFRTVNLATISEVKVNGITYTIV